ncbi:MAG: DNA repair protein RecO [Parcubacteria group bacterium Gr01-1014_29]|nr:MAG: DNA repair protein RecO [Parcubacteria group bacterium Gr01-1014_29]
MLDSYQRAEGDRLFSLYTERYGLVPVLAKGIRYEKSKMRGCLDMYARVHVGFVAGKELYRLTYAEARPGYTRLQSELFRFRGARAVGDMISHLVGEKEGDPLLWELVVETFAFLNETCLTAVQLTPLLYGFQIKLFSILGYLPGKRPTIVDVLYNAKNVSVLASLGREEREDVRAFLRAVYVYVGPPPHVVQTFLSP